jgi:hypothetical protein
VAATSTVTTSGVGGGKVPVGSDFADNPQANAMSASETRRIVLFTNAPPVKPY